MNKTKFPGFWYIGKGKTIINSPTGTKELDLMVFVDSKTLEVFVGKGIPVMKVDTFSSKMDKAIKPRYYDISQTEIERILYSH